MSGRRTGHIRGTGPRDSRPGRRDEAPRRERDGKRDSSRREVSRRGHSRRGHATGPMKVARRTLPAHIGERIDSDEHFQVVTGNGSHWIDPFTGAAVPLPPDISDLHGFIAEHLLATDSWRREECLDLTSLSTQRWRLDLQRLLHEDKRFRLFSHRDGNWLNPYNGKLVDSVRRPHGSGINQAIISAMARALAEDGIAMDAAILSPEELRRKMNPSEDGGDQQRSAEYAAVEDDSGALTRDLERATQVQARMLLEPPTLPGYEIARIFQPHSAVSGDAYDLHLDADGTLHFLIADVAGHGLQGAIIAAGLLRTVRMLRRSISDPKDLLVALNNELKPELLPGQFVTLCVGVLDPRTHVVRVCLAGHHPCLIVNPNGSIMLSRLGRPGLVLGIADDQSFADTLSVDEVRLAPDEVLVQFTDGIVEANDGTNEYGVLRLATRMLRRRASGCSLQRLLQDGVRSAERFCGGQLGDDVTLLGVSRNHQA